MVSKRERYERANMRGGLGVRKRLSEESLRETYRLNGVRTGMAVARCLDRYGRWDMGFTVGIIVRKTASIVQLRWADSPDEIHTYDQGDARYEVDRGRWRVLGLVQSSPLAADDPIAVALTKLRQEHSIGMPADDADTPPTEEIDAEMAEKMSKAAQERAAAKKALTNGELKERETYTAKQVAARCGTDSKTMRKFFRSPASTVEPVGQGGRYEFDSKDFPKIKREFDAWRKKAVSRQTKPKPPVIETDAEDISLDRVADAIERAQEEPEVDLYGEDPGDPTEEDLAKLEDEDIDLDDLELDD